MYRLRPTSISDKHVYSDILGDSLSSGGISYSILVDDFIVGSSMYEIINKLYKSYGSKGVKMFSSKQLGIQYETNDEDTSEPILRTLIFTFNVDISPEDMRYLQGEGFNFVRHIFH